MAVAYAAPVSVMNTVQQILHHPRPPISLDKEQVVSLTEKVTFLQDFLQGYSHFAGYSEEADALEMQITDAAYAAEDIIESHIADQILAGSTSHGEKTSSVDLHAGLQKAIGDMDFVKKKVAVIKEKIGEQDQLHINSSISGGSFRPAATVHNSTMVGCENVLYEIMDKLTGGEPHRQIIPIVGMGGIGKTTLARNIYHNQVVVQRFDILVWATISQEYKMREILLELLQEGGGNLSQMNEHELGDELHKKLSSRRYLIVMDDIWDIEVWDELKLFFPTNNNGSRIMLTTRQSNLASHVADSRRIDMAFLDENNSWSLFSKTVFGEESCPLDLEGIGKNIARNCKGLPLSIIVIGGLLAKSKRAHKYWEYTLENLNSIVNLEDNERVLQILYMSYSNLPVHLKSCFLYMGVFEEDSTIRVSELIKLWSAEGFLKPIECRSLKEVAEESLQELVDRNLILVEERNYNGKVKLCKIHDLLRDLCLREARKLKFFCVIGEQITLNIPQDINTERRICIHESYEWDNYPLQILHAMESASLARSLLIWEPNLPPFSSRLLRVSSAVIDYEFLAIDEYYGDTIFQQVNLRYLVVRSPVHHLVYTRFPSSISLLWNLQTLIVKNSILSVCAPSEIWKMSQLRHVKFSRLKLPDPSTDDFVVLENLETLLIIENFECGEEVVKRVPNLKKLKAWYNDDSHVNYYINNLRHLNKLESLDIIIAFYISRRHLVQNLTALPHSLKKLTLTDTCLDWEDMTMKIGSLPLLEVLKLKATACIGSKWETVEGQFCSLIFLQIEECNHLEYWMTECSHFPRLERLVLRNLRNLINLPSDIGEIATLKSIELRSCGYLAKISAKRMQVEQEELGNVGLQFLMDERA